MIEVMFSDLTPEKQQEVLDAYGYTCESDGNWEVVPLTFIAVPDEE